MNTVIILGSEGLIGKTLLNYLSDQNLKIIGVDKNIESKKQTKKNRKFDLTTLENQEDFDFFMTDLVGQDNLNYISIIDCMLIKKN